MKDMTSLFESLYELRDLDRCYRKVADSTYRSHDDVRRALEEHENLSTWLRAEASHQERVQEWLDAQRRWKAVQHLVETHPSYRHAAAGWKKMKEASPRLDGVDDFKQLSPLLQERYALFAEGVIESRPGTGEPTTRPGFTY